MPRVSPQIFAINMRVSTSGAEMKSLKQNQNSRMKDSTPKLCHIQLTQIDCTLHYSVSAWKINKHGENPPSSPLSHPILEGRGGSCCCAVCATAPAGRWCIDTIQIWPIESQLL